MEFASGGDLHNLQKRNLSQKARIDIFLSIAEATDFAHSLEIIHRDIKPANVLVRGDGSAALTDLDISDLAFAGTQSISAAGLGSPQFAAPEQLIGGEVANAHPTADVFSLGKMLFFLLAERAPPFGATEVGSFPDYLREVPLPNARDAIAQAIQISPNARPQSVSDLLRITGL